MRPQRIGHVLILLVVMAVAAFGAVFLAATLPAHHHPIGTPRPAHTAPPAKPIVATSTADSSGAALPLTGCGPDTCMGGRWEPPVVTIDNQVGEWFTPILQQAVNAWAAAGSPVTVNIAYGGPPACEPGQQPPDTVVVCLHPMVPPIVSVDCSLGPCLTPQANTHLEIDVTNCAEPYCGFIDGMIWIQGGLPISRLIPVVIHEIGHVLGVSYNLAQPSSSVMGRQARTTAIAPADIATLHNLYGQ